MAKKIEDMDREELSSITSLFSTWLKPYTHEVIVKVMERREEIINNKFAMQLMTELFVREEAEAKDFNRSMRQLLTSYNTFKEYDPHNHVLEHSKSYRDVLYDMYIR